MFNQIFDPVFLMFMAKLALAMLLGLLLGLERVYAHKTAGMRTYALVSVAAAAFVAVSVTVGSMFPEFKGAFNPVFIAGDIVVGVGFLGAGLIFQRDGHIENLTTSAGLWVCAGLGMMAGFGMFREAIFTTLITFFVLGALSFVERSVRLALYPDPAFEKELAAEHKPRKRRTKTVVS